MTMAAPELAAVTLGLMSDSGAFAKSEVGFVGVCGPEAGCHC